MPPAKRHPARAGARPTASPRARPSPHRSIAALGHPREMLARDFNRDSPDESQTGINVRVFPALLQDGREVLTATSTSGNPNAWSRVDLAVFPGIWAHSFFRLLLNESHRPSHPSAVASSPPPSPISPKISWNLSPS